ncbi:helix-turn-helix domain-containing protein [Ferrovibrio terrae]|uniref:GlxA family transcriptional regulator n=1 Tax=Ferrovibrio terrae TaxID=2594003 RepID=UPI00313785D1
MQQHTVVVVVYEGALLLNIAGPAEVFSTANRELASTPVSSKRPYRLQYASLHAGQVGLSCGLHVATEKLTEIASGAAQTVLVPGGPGYLTAARNAALVSHLTQIMAGAERACAIGNGAYLLARTGQLDRRHCVTHWRYVDEMRRDFPTVRTKADAVYVRDGKFFTSAGVSAGLDLCIELVEQDLGPQIAAQTARSLVVFMRRSGTQPQISASLAAQDGLSSRMREAISWISDNYHRDIKIGDMASQANMSERNFARQFRKEHGVSPGQFLERIRLEAAKTLFSETRLTIGAVSRRVGFSSSEHLARLFKRCLGVTPLNYRKSSRRVPPQHPSH